MLKTSMSFVGQAPITKFNNLYAMDNISTRKMIEALVRILCDIRPDNTADAAYLYAQTQDNEHSVFLAAKRILEDSLAYRVVLLDTASNRSYRGFDIWRERLIELGIPGSRIIGTELGNTFSHNTLTESQALIKFAEKNNYESIILSAAPFHQLRAYMTAVRVVLAEYPKLKIYSFPGETLPWYEEVAHSQGSLTERRSKLIETELLRIEKYYKKGDLISFDNVLEYLDKRDARQ